MSLFRNIVKIGIAKKLIDEARKPHNQARIKKAISSTQEKRAARSRGTRS